MKMNLGCHMKNAVLLSSVASLALFAAGSANAADLPARVYSKAPPPVQVFSWTGCYVGGHVGWGWARNNTTHVFDSSTGATITQTLTGTVDASGGVFGGQVGCNYQFSQNWVVGVEGSISAADINGSNVDPRGAQVFFFGANDPDRFDRVKIDGIASVTARVGYTWDQKLLYVKGGGAWARSRWDVSDTLIGAPFGERIQTQTGWTAGAGFEWAFMPSWSAFIEYAHYDFGTKNLATPADFASFEASRRFDIKQTIEVAKVGVNYRFTGF
jgi:outer membrane immunogenic protein